MDEAQGGGSGEDLISALPDELLHCILVRLRSARAAARTSVLSRRWRPVWAHAPEILLDIGLEAPPPAPPATFLDTVDGALAGCLAPTLARLSIFLSTDPGLPITVGRVAPWLRFAAGRVSGELRLFCSISTPGMEEPGMEEPGLELSPCGRAETIKLSLPREWWLLLQPMGLFASLTVLVIYQCHMKGSELTTLVCTQCPRLSNLDLCVTLVADANVSIRSDSLQSLVFYVNAQRLEVVAPGLEELCLSRCAEAHISAPKLAMLVLHDSDYDPCNYHFADIPQSLRLLQINCRESPALSMMRRFNEVDVLKLQLFILGIVEYESFLNDIKRLPKCKTLSISLFENDHGLAPVIHLLRRCNSTRKLSLHFFDSNVSSKCTCPSSCPCRLEQSRRIDNINLSSLDEVEIGSFKISHQELEFVELVSRCNATFLKKLVFKYMTSSTPETKEVCEKVRRMYGPNVEVEFYVS